MIGFGILFLMGAIIMVSVLGIARVPGASFFLIGAGLAFALGWLSLVLDPNAADENLQPVIAGLLVAALGYYLARRASEVKNEEAEG
jgi:hypothetical protein